MNLQSNIMFQPVDHMSSFTCIATYFTDDCRVVVVVVVVLHPHWRHQNSTNSRLAVLGLGGNRRNTGLAVLIAACDEALFYEGTVAVARGIRGRRAVHRVTTTLLFII